MKKRVRRGSSLILAVIVAFVTIMGGNPYSIPETYGAGNGKTVHFHKPGDWDQVNIYYYDDGGEAKAWPGTPMTLEGDNWYAFEINSMANPRVIFNDGKARQIPSAQQAGLLIRSDSWYKNGELTNSNPNVAKGDITIHVEKPDSWGEIWLWYDSDLSTEQWETTRLRSAPGDMQNYRPNWYRKKITNTDKVQFLFNDGSWGKKLNSKGRDFESTRDVWIKGNGEISYKDPIEALRPTAVKLEGGSSFQVGETTTVRAKILYNDGSEREQAVEWSLNNSALAKIADSPSRQANIRAISSGKLVVTASFEGLTSSLEMTINALPELTEDYIKVFFESPWNGAKIYYWKTEPSLDSINWPGVDMTSEGNGWYSYTLENVEKANIIFNNGGSSQTADLSRTAGEWFYYNNSWTDQDPRIESPVIPEPPVTPVPSQPVVTASPSSGRYLTAQNVTLEIKDSTDPSAKLYFALDGVVPELTDTYLYRGQTIALNKDTTINTVALDSAGNRIENYFMYNIGQYESKDFREETVYFVMTPRFYDGDPSNNAHCWDDDQAKNPDSDPAWRGDFKGLSEKLDYIKALGFSAIWITPPVKNSSGYDYHGYHAIDFTEIDPRYKTKYDNSAKEAYQKFINAAHVKGIKVIQDVVFNHTGNFGEENIFPMFERADTVGMDETSDDALMRIDNGRLPDNYESMNPNQQYDARIKAMKEDETDTEHIYHHQKDLDWEGYSCQTAQIAGDCVDLNTENPYVSDYLIDAYSEYINMGVDAFRIDTAKHMSRLTFNKEFIPKLKAVGGEDFYMVGEVCTRVRDVWNRGNPALSTPFYTWKESKEYPWGDRVTNEASAEQNYYDNQSVSDQPSSRNAFLDGNTYHTPDTSMKSGLDVIDFPMHWNFANARDAFRVAVNGDSTYNDATWNLVYVDSHDYAPDCAPENQRFSLDQDVWAENLSLMFTFRGIPCLYYGSEIEFQKGQVIDVGPNAPLSKTGRAYFGDHIEGSVQVSDFGVYSNATGTMADSLNHPLAQHIIRLNRLRREIPALQKGQYSVEDISGNDMAFKRRYTADGVDSFVLVTISGKATFNNIPNGKYVDAITGQTINVSNGTLSANCSGKGNMRVFVLDSPGNPAPGKIGDNTKYLGDSPLTQ